MTIGVTHVDDAEQLIRRVPAVGGCFKSIAPIELSSTAFNDRSHKPSVDRLRMKASSDDCKLQPTDGLVMLIAGEVRAIDGGIVMGANNKPLVDASGNPTGETYRIDVLHRPIEASATTKENAAHTQIETTPAPGRSPFERIKERLARLADTRGWIVEPKPP